MSKEKSYTADTAAGLVQMVRKAYEACKWPLIGACPWCTGFIRPDEEGHDETCPWPGFLILHGDPSKPKPQGIIQT